MRSTYLLIHWLLLLIFFVLLLLSFILFHPLALSKIAEYGLKESDIKYEKIQGRLFSGFKLQNVAYETVFNAKEVSVEYDLLSLILHGISIKSVVLNSAVVDLNSLDNAQDSNSTLKLPPITLQHLSLNNFTLLSSEKITIDGKLKKAHFEDSKLHVNSLDTKVITRFAQLKLSGKIDENIFIGKSNTIINESHFKTQLEAFKTLPKNFNINIDHASVSKLVASVKVKKIEPKNAAVSIDDANIALNYIFAQNSIDVTTNYLLNLKEANATVSQKLHYKFDGNYHSSADVEILALEFKLPELTYTVSVAGNMMLLDANISCVNSNILSRIQSRDMKVYSLDVNASKVSSNFLTSLPNILLNREIYADLKATITTQPSLVITGETTVGDDTTSVESQFEFTDANFLTQGIVSINEKSAQWSDIQTKNLFPMHFVANYSKQEGLLALRSNEIYTTLFKRGDSINGWGNYRSSRFDIDGTHKNGKTKLHVNKHIESVYELINSITPLKYKKFQHYDAELITKSTLTIDDSFSIESIIELPWYVAQSDSQTINFGHNSKVKLYYEKNQLKIDEYEVNMLEHNIDSKRDSYVNIDDEFNIHVKEFWIYDSLKLSGLYGMHSKEVDLNLEAKAFHYDGKEANLTAAMDISIEGNIEKQINIDGAVNILDAVIKYYPSKSYMMHDDDIIILQDVKAPKESKLFINVGITSAKKLQYRAKEIELYVKPDFTIWKDVNEPLVLLGMTDISNGKAYVTDKLYRIQESKIYFGGDHPVNPYLDMNILYEIDYKQIHIYITNTLEDPVVLFSSTPSLSQNDIMSYLIFGTPSNSAFDGGEEFSGASAANLILGSGLKSMIGDTTGIHVDTLNIISSESGGLGFEVGTRVNDDTRILFKNDSEFSAILQYKLNRWLRLDVDVKETGQGVKFIYVKDLRDPFKKENKK
ncbi:MAG: translocation/assembly module TamB domain-containing protein [Campylobacterota bacterium]|nr:translocation/assembly module TamB domain-containing protein [Campylobacterota bacterium]